MEYVNDNVFTVVNADDISTETIKVGIFGYFSNEIGYLKQAIDRERINSHCVYGQLADIMPETEAKRFVFGRGDYMYALFYPTDTYLNIKRY